MKRIAFNDTMIRKAVDKANQLGQIPNSITKGAGNTAGYLAEIALAKHLNCENVSCDLGEEKYNYDLIKNGNKIEVKTKRRTVDPLPQYEVSIAETSKHQQTDFYAFISITFGYKDGFGRNAKYFYPEAIWLCGFMRSEDYFKKARYLKKGQVDRTNGFTVHANMFNLPIYDLLENFPNK